MADPKKTTVTVGAILLVIGLIVGWFLGHRITPVKPLPPDGPDVEIDPHANTNGNNWTIAGLPAVSTPATGTELNHVAFGTKLKFEGDVTVNGNVYTLSTLKKISGTFGGNTLVIDASSGSFVWTLNGQQLTPKTYSGANADQLWRSDLCPSLTDLSATYTYKKADGSDGEDTGPAAHVLIKAVNP